MKKSLNYFDPDYRPENDDRLSLETRLSHWIKSFWSKIKTVKKTNCMLWKEETNEEGQPIVLSIKGEPMDVKRVAYMLQYGVQLPSYDNLVSRCGTEGCVNPMHYYDSEYDDLGRNAGDRNNYSKFTREQVYHMRVLRASGRYKLTDLAAMFNTDKYVVCKICRGKKWAYKKKQ